MVKSLTYGTATPTLSAVNAGHVAWSGFVNGDAAGALDSTTFSYGGAAAGSVNNAGTYALGISAFSDNNYSLSLPGGVANGTLTIAALSETESDDSPAIPTIVLLTVGQPEQVLEVEALPNGEEDLEHLPVSELKEAIISDSAPSLPQPELLIEYDKRLHIPQACANSRHCSE